MIKTKLSLWMHDRGAIGYLLDIDIWQSGTTRIMQDGIVVKGLSPKPCDPLRYHINPQAKLSKLEEGMPWRTTKDEFGKFKWIDHEGRVCQGTPFAVEPDATAKTVFYTHVPLMSKTVNVKRKLFTMKKFQHIPSPRRALVTKSRTSLSKPRSQSAGSQSQPAH